MIEAITIQEQQLLNNGFIQVLYLKNGNSKIGAINTRHYWNYLTHESIDVKVSQQIAFSTQFVKDNS